MAVWSQRKETVDAAIAFSKEKCGCAHMELKREQRRALTEVLGRKDSVVVLPTGYGKSLIYLLLPFADLFVRRDAANGKFCSTSSGAAHVLSGRPDGSMGKNGTSILSCGRGSAIFAKHQLELV